MFLARKFIISDNHEMSLSIYNSLDGVLSQDKVFFSHYLFHFYLAPFKRWSPAIFWITDPLNVKWLIYIKLGPQEFKYKLLVFSQIRDVMEKLTYNKMYCLERG